MKRVLRDRRALLTGASRGIGPHIARALAREGVNLAITARSTDGLALLAAELEGAGGRVQTIAGDLRSGAERERVVTHAVAALGGIDVLINNAAVDNSGPFLALGPEALAETITTNLTAPVHLTALVLPSMLERGSGHIVNIASLAGKKAVPFEALYGGTKAALIEWSSALRIELHGTGVSLSAVCPGYVTGEGMFARWKIAPPRLFGSTTPAAVASGVVRALRKDLPEVVVNSRPVRAWLALYAIAPGFAGRMVDVVGLTAFQRRKVGAGD